jgi:hypothetical protein
MSGPEQDSHDAEWRERLAALAQDDAIDLPGEAQTVAALKQAGVLRSERKPPGFGRLLLGVAAGLVLFLAGSWWGRQGDRVPAAQGQRFALFLLEDSTFQGTEQVGHDSLVAEYSAWAGELAENGNLVMGEELGEEAWPVGPTEPERSPAARITGFFILTAASEEAALALARSSPHLRYGGAIVVRPIVPT